MRAGRIVTAGTPDQVVAERPSSIRFTLPEGLAPQHLPQTLPPATVRDGRVEIRTPRLQDALTDLLLWARQSGVELPGLHARTATLEEVFLEIAQLPDDDGGQGGDGQDEAQAKARTQDGTAPGEMEVERV